MSKKSTKDRILEHSLMLFAKSGYKETSVRDIAKEVGIQQGALYNHFKNKDAILETLIDELAQSAIVSIFENKDPQELAQRGKSFLSSVATIFKLISFDKKNEALYKMLMQEIYKNPKIRDFYHEYFYQKNVKKISSILFYMMQDERIKSSDPLLLANEFLAPLFFYQNQVLLLKIDAKSTSSAVMMFEKHVEFFWSIIRSDGE